MGCTYEVDRLFVLKCPSQKGLWITDAQSLLDKSNCKEECANQNIFDPELTYIALDREL